MIRIHDSRFTIYDLHIMEQRLQKLIAAAGIASRRHAEELIAAGRVTVNGKVVTELGTKADPENDHIKVNGKLINPQLKSRGKSLRLPQQAERLSFQCFRSGRPSTGDGIAAACAGKTASGRPSRLQH